VVVVAGVQMGRAVISRQFSRVVSGIGIQNISALSPLLQRCMPKTRKQPGSNPEVSETKG